MNYQADELFALHTDGKSYFTEYEREKIIDDIYYLEERLSPKYGLVNGKPKEFFRNLKISDLINIHYDQNTVFAVFHFQQTESIPRRQSIFGFLY